jgi:glycosyltransferase involved in cell wall biosynthesis
MAAPHCLIYERDVGGHRLHHVHHLVDALLEVGCEVSVATRSDAREKDEYRVHLSALEPRFRFVPGPLFLPNNLKNGWRTGTDFLNTIRESKPDRVYFPCTEYLTQAFALRCLVTGRRQFAGPPIEGHLNRGTYAYPSESMRDVIRGVVSKRLARRSPWQITHLLDPWVYDSLRGPKTTTEFRVIPEPVEPLPQVSREEARRILGAPLDGRYVAMIGGIRPNKGLDGLLAAFSRAKLAADDRMLLVGSMDDTIRKLVYEQYGALHRQGRIVCVDRYVTDHELDAGFIAANVVAVTHEKLIGSSGTLVRAAHAGTPLVTTNYGWAGWATRTFELGTTANVADIDALSAALENAFKTCTSYRISEKGERFCRFHTLANWKAHWVAGIGRDCGIPLGDLSGRLEWNWAMKAVDPNYTG